MICFLWPTLIGQNITMFIQFNTKRRGSPWGSPRGSLWGSLQTTNKDISGHDESGEECVKQTRFKRTSSLFLNATLKPAVTMSVYSRETTGRDLDLNSGGGDLCWCGGEASWALFSSMLWWHQVLFWVIFSMNRWAGPHLGQILKITPEPAVMMFFMDLGWF